jgi:NAD(P)-dependent dehydrogenase (short-subunit alcohol dehydrogenase family)
MVEVIPIVVNLENQESRDNAIARIRSITSDIDILINNAAFIGDSKLDGWNTGLSSQSIETWRRAIEVNLTSIFDLTKNLSPAMGKKNSSSIINISSIYYLGRKCRTQIKQNLYSLLTRIAL